MWDAHYKKGKWIEGLVDIVSGVVMIHARCPECGVILQVDYKQRGRRVRCPKCQTSFPVEETALRGTGKPRVKKKPRKKQQEKQLARPLKPYEQIDESVLAQIPFHHRFRNVCLVLGGLVMVGVAVFFCWKLIPQGNKAGASAGPVALSLPAYAERLHECIRAAGYSAEKGAVNEKAQYYHCRLQGRLPIHLYAFADGAGVGSTGFYACGKLRRQGEMEQEEARKALGKIMGEYLAESDSAAFSQWVWTTFSECWRALGESKAFAREERFGEMIVRLNHCELYDLGFGVAVSVMRAND